MLDSPKLFLSVYRKKHVFPLSPVHIYTLYLYSFIHIHITEQLCPFYVLCSDAFYVNLFYFLQCVDHNPPSGFLNRSYPWCERVL